jgi:nitrogen fixation protein NifU and related proteins
MLRGFFMTESDIYRETLLEYYKNPENKRSIEKPDIHKQDNNPVCGDSVEIFIKLDEKKKIKEMSFQGTGCVISMVSAEMLCQEIIGKKLGEVQKMDREDILKMMNLKLTPTRIKCAMLPLVATKKGIIDFYGEKYEQK